MARIEWVKHKLDNWARWQAQQQGNGLGYPKQTAFARLSRPAGGWDNVIPINDVDAAETDRAVSSLRLAKSHLYLTLQHIYVDGWGIKRTAVVMGKAESTVKGHLDQADHALAAWYEAQRERREQQQRQQQAPQLHVQPVAADAAANKTAA